MRFQVDKKVNLVAVGLIALAVLIGFSAVSFQAAQPSEVIRVPQEFPTIQEAINASLSGDTILIDPKPDGEPYRENLVIGKGGVTPLQWTVYRLHLRPRKQL